MCISLLQAVVEDDPDYVVRRFESGRYAVDSESRRIYQRALELVEVCVVMPTGAYCLGYMCTCVCFEMTNAEVKERRKC